MKYLLTVVSLLSSFSSILAGECNRECTDLCSDKLGLFSEKCSDDLRCECTCNNGEVWLASMITGFCTEVCFSSEVKAIVKNIGEVFMSDIKVGDKVLTGSGNYETVYTIDHRHLTKPTKFVQIYSEKEGEDSPLELTSKHMVFVEVDGESHPVTAESVNVGDQIQTPEGFRPVTKIGAITRAGLFSPLTSDGTIVANGVTASTYSAHFGTNEWIEISGMKVMTNQKFFQTVLKPYSLFCTNVSLELCKTNNERTIVGDAAVRFKNHVLQQHEVYQMVVISFIVLFAYVLDFMLSPCGMMILATSFVSLCTTFVMSKSKKMIA